MVGQTAVDSKSNEVTAFAPLIDRLDLADVLVTADALHTHRGHADYLHARGGHYLWVVKANQPRLHTQLRGLPWSQIPVFDEQKDRGHGRVETRRVKLTAVGPGIGFPHAHLAIQVQRRRRPLRSPTWSSETVYAITSMNWRQARADLVAQAIRGHWQIESLHWIRDVTFGEDLSQIRTGNGPAVMATLRNTAVSRHRLDGPRRSRAHAGTPPDTPTARWHCSHNRQINYDEALVVRSARELHTAPPWPLTPAVLSQRT